ncbi:MAG: MGMT family protein [Planctomycetota bacterium]
MHAANFAFDHPRGTIYGWFSERGLRELRLPTEANRRRHVHVLHSSANDARVWALNAAMARFFRGVREDFDEFELDLEGHTPFRQAVWMAARQVPGGTTATYGALAEAVGKGKGAARAAGLRTGVRFTLVRDNRADLDAVIDLVEAERIPRLCVYHLAYSGRGADLRAADLPPDEARSVLDRLLDHARRLDEAGRPIELLTVDNHCDGVLLYLRLLRESPGRAAEALTLLRRAGGNASGERIACISWDGTVYPDQFWRTRPLGNVRARPFRTLWADDPDPFLLELRDRRRRLRGRCGACRWIDLCNGNLRARAEAVTGDPWAADPACLLTEEEVRGVVDGRTVAPPERRTDA